MRHPIRPSLTALPLLAAVLLLLAAVLAAPARAATGGKGVSANPVSGASQDIADVGASWYYDWGPSTGAIAKQISADFGDFEAFKKLFNETTAKQFGPGWGWLVFTGGKLKVITTANQDSPLSQGLYPILGNDVWEHAYYLKYQNRRPDYLAAWWNVVKWDAVNERFAKAKA